MEYQGTLMSGITDRDPKFVPFVGKRDVLSYQ